MAKKTKIQKVDIDYSKSKEEREYDGLREWIDYWRQNPS